MLFASVLSEHISSGRLIPLTSNCPCKSVQCQLCLFFFVPTSDHIDIAGMAHCTVLQDDLRLAARSGCQSGSSKYHFARTCWQHALLCDVRSSLGACDLVRTKAALIDQGQLQVVYQATDTVSQRLRRWTRNPLGSARRGSNPLGVAICFLCECKPCKSLFAHMYIFMYIIPCNCCAPRNTRMDMIYPSAFRNQRSHTIAKSHIQSLPSEPHATA